jgi:hypothetical protein
MTNSGLICETSTEPERQWQKAVSDLVANRAEDKNKIIAVITPSFGKKYLSSPPFDDS